MKQTLELTAKGGTVIMIAQRPKGVFLDYPLAMFKELRLQGVFGQTARDFRDAVELLGSRKIKVAPLITETFSLADIQPAYNKFLKPDSIKIIVNP